MEQNRPAEVAKETNIHGSIWNKIHSGYFSSPEKAATLLDMIKKTVVQYKPKVIVDLGAGTGTVLHWLSEILNQPKPKLIAMDISDAQLVVIEELYPDQIIPLKDSFTNFDRNNIKPLADSSTLFISRSTFHYVGEEFFSVLIRHIRNQMNTGEHLIHQTACFANANDAQLLNDLYALMHSAKWYPSLDLMKQVFEKNRFKLEQIVPAPALPLKSSDLQIRYALTEKQIFEIINMATNNYQNADNKVFISNSNSFTAYLHYYCMHCVAI